MTATVARTGREVLTRALTGIRTGDVEFGAREFHDHHGRSCLIGIIAWATDPSYHERDPFVMHPAARRVARQALEAVAAVLNERGELPPYPTTEHPDRVSGEQLDERLEPLSLLAIGEWSDDQSNALPVIEVLEAALERVP